MRIIKITLIIILTITLTSCERYDFAGFISSPSKNIEERFKESMQYNKNHQNDTLLTLPYDQYNIYACSDIHTATTCNKLSIILDRAFHDNELGFISIIGDITDKKGGLEIARDTISLHSKNSDKIKCLVGNHDLFFNQWEKYKQFWGTSIYYFVVTTPSASDLYISLDTGNGTLGKKQMKWLEELLAEKRKHYRHCIIFSHTNMWVENFDQFPSGSISLKETVKMSSLFSKYDVEYYVNGHVHKRNKQTLNGVDYITTDSMKDKDSTSSYIIFNVGKTITYQYHNI